MELILKSIILLLTLLITEIANTNCLNNNKISMIKSLLNVEKSVTALDVINVCNDTEIDKMVIMTKELNVPIIFHPSLSSMNDTWDLPLWHRKIFAIDLNECSSFSYNFLTINQIYLQHPFRWVIFASNLQIFEKVPALLASNLIIALPKVTGFELKQVYKIKYYSQTQIENYGYWTKTEGLVDTRVTSIISRRRKDMKGEMLIATTTLNFNDTLQYLFNYKNKQWDTPIRVIFNQMDIVLDLLNGTKRFIFTPRFGYDETGIWVGASGNLINEHADICTSPFFVTAERLHLLDYVAMIGPFKGYFIFRAPRLSSVANIYTLPFSRIVWICFGVSALILTIFLYIVMKSEDTLLKNYNEITITDVVLLSVSAICQMGSALQTNMISTRILTFFLFITFVFTYTSFTASIVALLQSSTKSIQTLHDLYNSEIELGAEDTLYNRYYFGKTEDPVRLKIFRDKISPPGETPRFYDIKTGVSKIRQGMYGFFAPGTDIYKEIEETFLEHEKCGLNQIEYLEIVEPYQALKKNSPLKEILKVNLMKVREHGITIAEVNRMCKTRPLCVAVGQRFESVSFNDCYGAVVLLGYGFVFAFFIFIIELLQNIAIKRYKVIRT